MADIASFSFKSGDPWESGAGDTIGDLIEVNGIVTFGAGGSKTSSSISRSIESSVVDWAEAAVVVGWFDSIFISCCILQTWSKISDNKRSFGSWTAANKPEEARIDEGFVVKDEIESINDKLGCPAWDGDEACFDWDCNCLVGVGGGGGGGGGGGAGGTCCEVGCEEGCGCCCDVWDVLK